MEIDVMVDVKTLLVTSVNEIKYDLTGYRINGHYHIKNMHLYMLWHTM